VLSYDLWRNRYGADPGILGGKILVDEQPLTVIGVAAPGFHGVEVERRAEVWVPAMMARMKFMDPRCTGGSGWWRAAGRRYPGAAGASRHECPDGAAPQRSLYPPYNAAIRKRALGQRLEVREGSVGLSVLREEFGRPLT
jgi:hypothetical protein